MTTTDSPREQLARIHTALTASTSELTATGIMLRLVQADADTLLEALREDRLGHRHDGQSPRIETTDGATVEFTVEGTWDRRDMTARNGYFTVTGDGYYLAASLSLREANSLAEQLTATPSPPVLTATKMSADLGDGYITNDEIAGYAGDDPHAAHQFDVYFVRVEHKHRQSWSDGGRFILGDDATDEEVTHAVDAMLQPNRQARQ